MLRDRLLCCRALLLHRMPKATAGAPLDEAADETHCALAKWGCLASTCVNFFLHSTMFSIPGEIPTTLISGSETLNVSVTKSLATMTKSVGAPPAKKEFPRTTLVCRAAHSFKQPHRRLRVNPVSYHVDRPLRYSSMGPWHITTSCMPWSSVLLHPLIPGASAAFLPWVCVMPINLVKKLPHNDLSRLHKLSRA